MLEIFYEIINDNLENIPVSSTAALTLLDDKLIIEIDDKTYVLKEEE